MNTDTIKIDGFTVTIANDEHADNPFESWDCEPALLAYSGDRHGGFSTYQNAPACMADFVALLPDSCFERGKRLALLEEFKPANFGWRKWLKEFAECKDRHGHTDRDALAQILAEEHGEKPEGWRGAGEWFDCAEALLTFAGIPFHSTESHGYCQGDTVKLLAIATPGWVKLVGAPVDSLERQCEAACKLYGAWAWGDVYGILSIHAPGSVDEDGDEIEGEELEEGSVWGFYGNDHEESGLLESARETIQAYQESRSRVDAIASRMCLA